MEKQLIDTFDAAIRDSIRRRSHGMVSQFVSSPQGWETKLEGMLNRPLSSLDGGLQIRNEEVNETVGFFSWKILLRWSP